MHLLTPEKAKEGANKQEVELKARIRNLQLEESRLVSSVNSLREKEAEEKRRDSMREEERQASLGFRKTMLDAEVDALEKRKAEALKPTIEREDAVAKREEAVEIRAGQTAAWASEVKEKEGRVTSQLAALADRTQELDEREDGIKAKERAIDLTATELKRSTESLADKWVTYHKAVADKEKEITGREQALKHEKETQDVQMAERERRIADREADMERREKKLASDQIVVNKAWEELRRREKQTP